MGQKGQFSGSISVNTYTGTLVLQVFLVYCTHCATYSLHVHELTDIRIFCTDLRKSCITNMEYISDNESDYDRSDIICAL
jgi:hypothetical protein